MLLLALPIWILGNLQTFSPNLSDQCSQWFASAFGSQFVVNSMIIPALTVIYAVVALGRYSRLLEHDADLSVYDDGQAEVFCSTIDRLSYLSNDRRERRTWLHPSTVSRIHLLQRAILDPTVAAPFRGRVNRFNFALLAAWILTPVLLLVF